MTIADAKELGITLSDARELLACAYNDGTRINSSDSNVFVFVVSDIEKKQILDVLAADEDGKERELDKTVRKHSMGGFVARLRSIEYSRMNARRTELQNELAVMDTANPANAVRLAAICTELRTMKEKK